MKKLLIVLMAAIFLLPTASLFAQQTDKSGCEDHPLFPTRMPGYRIEDCRTQEFGIYDFWSTKGPKIPVEGKFTFITYSIVNRKDEPSPVAVIRNYENAIRKIGGTILQRNPNWWVNGKIVKNGQESWAQIEKGNGKVWLRIIEKKGMEQYVVANAAAIGNDIRENGHAAVYGIHFDTGRSTIKPESAQAIQEIAGLLKAEPNLILGIVGHTDNVGSIDSNIKLSKERAESVIQALIGNHGIDPSRLKAFGCGLFAPVASNETEEGRAKNRRVDLVSLKQEAN